MQIHIHRDGQDFGPYTLDQVHQYLQEGSIVASDMAWYDGAPDWIPLPKVPGVIVPAGAAAAVSSGGGKKTVIWISMAAVAAAAITGGIVFVAMNKGAGKSSQSAQAGSGNGGESGAGNSGSSAGGSGMDGDMAMDGKMAMDGDMAMAMDGEMGMDGGAVDPKKIHAMFEQKCFKCHGNGKSKGGFSLESRDGAMDAIKAGNPDGSVLMKLIRRDDEDEAMPPKSADALSKAEIAMVAAWIKAGAKW